MDLQHGPTTEQEALISAARIASSIRKQFTDLNIPQTQHDLPHNFDSLIPELRLTIPDDVLAPISALQLSDDLRQALMIRLERFIGDIQQMYRTSYRRSCLDTLRSTNSVDDIHIIHRTYQALSQRKCLPLIQQQVAFILTEVNNHCSIPSESKRPFNNEFTPVLERYFQFNGYPSVLHRSILAKKSGMIPRQIEVWFQNHRNRSKKDGRVPPRLDSDAPLRLALETLPKISSTSQNRLPTPSYEEATFEKSNKKNDMMQTHHSGSSMTPISFEEVGPCGLPALSHHLLESRPSHAFPAKRDSGFPDPFPTDNGVFKLPRPEWRRKPTTAPNIPTSVDIDEFTQMFHLKLNFSENSRRRGTTPSKRESPPSQPWFRATTTKPSTAPHPALIQKLHVSQPASPSLDASIGKPIVFGPNFLRGDTSTAFLPAPPGEAPARKTRPLPRRMPPRSPSSSFVSRTSSFSSDASSGSSAFSTSSSSSYSSSPELPTPPPLPDSDLPVFHDDAQHQDYLFDFSQTNLDTDYPSAPQTFDFSFNDPSLNKIPDLSCFSLHFPDFNNLAQIIS